MTTIKPLSGSQRPRSRRRLVWVIVGILFLAGIAGTWLLLRQGKFAAGPIHLDRTWIDAKNSLADSMVTCSDNDARISWRRLVVIDDTDHPFGRRVTEELATRLKSLPGVQSVETVLQDGAARPDLVFRVSQPSFQETNGILMRTVDAKIVVTMGNMEASNLPFFSSSAGPPRMQVSSETTLTHHSVSEGDGIGSDKYRLSAASAAESLAKYYQGVFAAWQEKPGAMPELPAAMYGPYVPATDLEWLVARHAVREMCGCGLLVHNDSWYRWTEAGDPLAIARSAAAELEKNGWKITQSNLADKAATHAATAPSPSSQVFVRLVKGERTVMLGRASREAFTPGQAWPAGHQETFQLHYLQAFTAAEREAAIDVLFKDGRVDDVGMFLGSMTPRQQTTYYTLLEARPTLNAPAALNLVRHYQSTDAARARRLLNKIDVIARLSMQDQTSSDRTALAKELGMKLGNEMVPSAAALAEAGAIHVDAARPLDRTVGLEEPVLATGTDADGRWALEVRVSCDSGGTRRLLVTRSQAHSGSMSDPAFALEAGKQVAQSGDKGYTVRAEELTPGPSYRIVVTVNAGR